MHRKNISGIVHRKETFALAGVFNSASLSSRLPSMNKILPLLFALIPLAAVVGACVACP